MVSSLDGFIAKKDGDVSWFETSDTYDKGVTGESSEEFLQTVGCFVMGARTYEQALALSRDFGWPYGDVPTYVLTHRDVPIERQSVQRHSGDLTAFVNERLKPSHGNVWVAGGASLIRDCIRLGLVDDIRVTIVPIILGDGTPFFGHLGQEQTLHLKDVTAFRTGMVDLWYEVRRA
jgi:dihydrofolate reductase